MSFNFINTSMKLSDILNETPLMGYETLSDTPKSIRGDSSSISSSRSNFASRSSSFTDRRDRHMITSDMAVKRLENKFQNTPEEFYFYMVNTKEARDFTEVGKVDRNWLSKNMPAVEPHIKDHEDGITVIFTNNRGDQKVVMTPWIMAHRIAHSFGRWGSIGRRHLSQYTEAEKEIARVVDDILTENYRYIPQQYSDPIKKRFFEAIGTFKSARDNKLRADFEFLHEVFAQHIMTGGIKFNSVPDTLATGGKNAKRVYFRGDREEANDMIDTLGRTLEYYVEAMLSEAVNGIYVM